MKFEITYNSELKLYYLKGFPGVTHGLTIKELVQLLETISVAIYGYWEDGA